MHSWTMQILGINWVPSLELGMGHSPALPMWLFPSTYLAGLSSSLSDDTQKIDEKTEAQKAPHGGSHLPGGPPCTHRPPLSSLGRPGMGLSLGGAALGCPHWPPALPSPEAWVHPTGP